MTYLTRTLTLWLLASLLLSAHAQTPDTPGTLLSATPAGTYQPDDIRSLAAPLFDKYGVPRLAAAVEAYDLVYTTTDLDGSSAQISAQLFIPVYTAPAERPLYVFGSGTTGLGDECAPSVEYSYGDHPLGYYRANLLAFASRGIISVIPNYLGFDDPEKTQPYFNAVAEAHVMLDAVRAVTAFFEQNPQVVAPSDAVFTGGYSQGGHAAFAAADLRPSYAPEVTLTGVIGYGATTNVARLMKEGPYYAPYLVQSFSTTYGADVFDPAEVLNARWVPTLEEDAVGRCVDRAQDYYPFDANLIYTPEFARALNSDTLETDFPNIYRVLEQNRTGLSGHGLPALIVQGEQDIIVRNPTQELFVRELCEVGSSVQYLNFPGVRHRFTRQVGFEESIAWMEGLARGEPAPSSCGL